MRPPLLGRPPLPSLFPRRSWVSASIARRLGVGFGVLLLAMAALVAVAVVEMRAMSQRLAQIVEVNNARADLAHRLLGAINLMAVQSRTVALLTSVKEIEAELEVMNKAETTYREAERALLGSVTADAPTATQALAKRIAEAASVTIPLMRSAAKDGADGASTEAMMTLTLRVRPAEAAWRTHVAAWIEGATRANDEAYAYARAAERRAFALLGAIAALAIAAGALMAWRIVVGVKRPIERAIGVAERIAEGDLSREVEVGADDELGRLQSAVAAMQQRLRTLVAEIRRSAQGIAEASTEVAAGNNDLSQRTEQGAARLQQTASAVRQLAATVTTSADAARSAHQLVAEAAGVAERGGSLVGDVVATMGQIDAASKKIADIIGTIDGIAFQTNILALNAAVEAARAGEQGRGFAVVAGEVRSLAQRSAEAAKQIKALIGASVERVESGSRLVRDAGQTMQQIVASVQKVSGTVAQIATAAGEQSGGIGQVNGTVAELDRMTQQNAALVEQSAAAAESLRGQAQRLTQLMGQFRTEAAA